MKKKNSERFLRVPQQRFVQLYNKCAFNIFKDFQSDMHSVRRLKPFLVKICDINCFLQKGKVMVQYDVFPLPSVEGIICEWVLVVMKWGKIEQLKKKNFSKFVG